MPRKQPKEAVRQRAASKGSSDDLIENITREGTQRRLEVKPPPPPAGPEEHLQSDGPWPTTLARAKRKRKTRGNYA